MIDALSDVMRASFKGVRFVASTYWLRVSGKKPHASIVSIDMLKVPVISARSRRFCLVGSAMLAVVSLWLVSQDATKFVVLNTSSSLPAGLYMRTSRIAQRSVLIEFRPPQSAREYANRRWGVVPETARFLKPVIAVPGDHVDAASDVLIVNGLPIASIQTHDSRGVELPRWKKARILTEDEFFVFSSRIPHSFDSRYFGPIHRNQILAVRRPLITW